MGFGMELGKFGIWDWDRFWKIRDLGLGLGIEFGKFGIEFGKFGIGIWD